MRVHLRESSANHPIGWFVVCSAGFRATSAPGKIVARLVPESSGSSAIGVFDVRRKVRLESARQDEGQPRVAGDRVAHDLLRQDDLMLLPGGNPPVPGLLLLIVGHVFLPKRCPTKAAPVPMGRAPKQRRRLMTF